MLTPHYVANLEMLLALCRVPRRCLCSAPYSITTHEMLTTHKRLTTYERLTNHETLTTPKRLAPQQETHHPQEDSPPTRKLCTRYAA